MRVIGWFALWLAAAQLPGCRPHPPISGAVLPPVSAPPPAPPVEPMSGAPPAAPEGCPDGGALGFGGTLPGRADAGTIGLGSLQTIGCEAPCSGR